MSFDIIGDIHGHADRLEALLKQMGYHEGGGAWRRPSRTVVFVGDLIDRGPGQLRTLKIVRAMLDSGSARAVMGNHEFNAIAWATPDPDHDGQHLRPRSQKNDNQHKAFLSEIPAGSREHRDWIAWFMDLPLWLDDPGMQVVHACWDPRQMDVLRPHLDDDLRLSHDLLVRASRKGSPQYEAVETLLKGPEAKLPDGYSFTDKDGHVRSAIRLAWWRSAASSYREAYVGPPGVDIPDLPLEAAYGLPEPAMPTFFGHYWFPKDQTPEPVAVRAACVDYSAAAGGPLVAYRFEGEEILTPDRFVAA